MEKFPGFMASIEKVRLTLRGLQADLHALINQRRSRAQVAGFVEESVQRWQMHGTAHIDADLARCAAGAPTEFLLLQAVVYTPRELIRIDVPLGPTLVALFGADVVREAILNRLDTVPVGLEPEARLERMGEIRDSMDALGYEEEGLIREAAGVGEFIEYRADADPHHALTWRPPV